jgi:hypothetical protein
MKSREFQINGRHVATICDDELRNLAVLYPTARGLVMAELSGRPQRGKRTEKPGYVPFSGGSRPRHGYVDAAAERPKPAHPDRPTNVKDAKKDRKKGEEK